MRRRFKLLLLTLSVPALLAAAGAGLLYGWISHPAVGREPLPAGLISLESDEGARLLAESAARRDYDALAPQLQTQEKSSWCGVASAVSVLNALHPSAALSQDAFFNDCTSGHRHWLRITFGGMTLDSFGQLLACHGASAKLVHAGDGSLQGFRSVAVANLQSAGDFVVVNYQRSVLGQGEMGHISPVAAYHASSDRFLVLDVASYKYPPVWVKADALWQAMDTTDTESGRRRGYALIRREATAP